MFCFQCEQTAGGRACTGIRGVCGKSDINAQLHDELTGKLVGLARAADVGTPGLEAHQVVIEGLFATMTNVNYDDAMIRGLIEAAQEQVRALTLGPGEQGGRGGRGGGSVRGGRGGGSRRGVRKCYTYNMARLWDADPDIRSLKALLLFGMRGMAAYAYHAQALGKIDYTVMNFFYKGLRALGEDLTVDELLTLTNELGTVNLICMELLNAAHTGAYGSPVPVQVERTVEPGPFIVISGHDLRDLELLLKQTQGSGVNVYTHGEMLAAHGYPALKKYAHLKGNFGTAWHNQRCEFAKLPAPILFTTNCLMPVRLSYADRVFTTGAVSYPGLIHIGGDKDFTRVIERALELSGYPEAHPTPSINASENKDSVSEVGSGSSLTTGYGKDAVLAQADTLVEALRDGTIRHIFLVGGCDGSRPSRCYFTEFVKQTPADTLVLTLGCGKYRFNDLELGEIAGLPRLLDLGQCNDAYSAIKIATALAEALDCGINDLPLTLVLSWYEQKAVCVLLSLLALDFKNILLGPSLPAFLSPSVRKILLETHGLTATTSPKEDLAKALG